MGMDQLGMDQWRSENDSGGPFGADSECQASLYTPARASRREQAGASKPIQARLAG